MDINNMNTSELERKLDVTSRWCQSEEDRENDLRGAISFCESEGFDIPLILFEHAAKAAKEGRDEYLRACVVLSEKIQEAAFLKTMNAPYN